MDKGKKIAELEEKLKHKEAEIAALQVISVSIISHLNKVLPSFKGQMKIALVKGSIPSPKSRSQIIYSLDLRDTVVTGHYYSICP